MHLRNARGGLTPLATSFMLSSTLADFIAAHGNDPQDGSLGPEPVYQVLPPNAYSKVIAGQDDFSLNAKVGDTPPTMVHQEYGDLNMFQPYEQGQFDPSYDNKFQELVHELANRMADEYEFLCPAFEESHELLRRFLTADGQAQGFYDKVCDCKMIQELASKDLSKIFDDKASEKHWSKTPQFWDMWCNAKDKNENPKRTGHEEYIGGKSYYDIGEFTSKEVNQVLSPWFSFAAEAAHGQIYSREIYGKRNKNRGNFQPTVWPNGFGYGGLQHTYDRLFRDKGYAVDQKNIRPSFKDADRTDNMDTTEFLVGFICMQAHHAFELCVAADMRTTFPEYVEHFKHSKLPSADFGQEGELSATQIIRQKIAKLGEYTEGTLEHAHYTLLLEYDLRFRIMMFALPRMHGWPDEDALERDGVEGFCKIQHAGNAGKFNSMRATGAIVDRAHPNCNCGRMSRFGFMTSFFWRASGKSHQELMQNPSNDFQVGQVDYQQWILKDQQLIPWRVKGILRNLDMNFRELGGHIHKYQLTAGITQSQFPRHKCRLRIMNEMLSRTLELKVSPNLWEMGIVQKQSRNVMMIPFTVKVQVSPKPVPPGFAKPGPLPPLDTAKPAQDDFSPNPAEQPAEDDWGEAGHPDPAIPAPGPPEEGEELVLEPAPVEPVFEERQAIAFFPVHGDEAGMSFTTTYQNAKGKTKQTEYNPSESPYESQCAVIIAGEPVVHRKLDFTAEVDEFTTFMKSHASGWKEKDVRRFITLRYYQLRDQLRQSWRFLVNHPLTRQANNHDEIDKFHREQVQTGLYAQEQYYKRLPTRIAAPNPYQTRMLPPSAKVFILARSSTEQLPKYCWFGTLERFDNMKSEMETDVVSRLNDQTTPEARKIYEQNSINTYLPLMGTDVAPTQKAAEIPKDFDELLQWTFVDETNVEKGIFIPKEAADQVRLTHWADFGQYNEESASKEEQIRRAYSVLRTGACARFRYSKDRAGEKVIALDADGNRIVDIVDSRTDLDFYKRNYQFRLKAHLVPHNEETAQTVTLDQQAALNQTKGKMASINRPSIANKGTGGFEQARSMKGLAQDLINEREARPILGRGKGQGQSQEFDSEAHQIQEDMMEERRIAQQQAEARFTLAKLKRDPQAPHVKSYLERFGYVAGRDDTAVPCPRHYHLCETRDKKQAIRPHWLGECVKDNCFTNFEIHAKRLPEGLLCKCCTGECDICATNATICNTEGELKWKMWRAHCWAVCSPPTQDGNPHDELKELEEMKAGRIEFTPRLFSRYRFDVNHDPRAEKNGVKHEFWCATLKEYETCLMNYHRSLQGHLHKKRQIFDKIDELPQPGLPKEKKQKTASPRTDTSQDRLSSTAKRAADFGQSGPQQKAQRSGGLSSLLVRTQDEIIAQYQDWENQVRDERYAPAEWDGASMTSSRDMSHKSEEWIREETNGWRQKPRHANDTGTILWRNPETDENETWFWFPRARHRDGGWWVNLAEVHKLDPMLTAERSPDFPGRDGPGRGHRPRQAKNKGGKGGSIPPPPPSIQRQYGRILGRDIRNPGEWIRDHEQRGNLEAVKALGRVMNDPTAPQRQPGFMPDVVEDPGYPEAQPADFRPRWQREHGYDRRDRQQDSWSSPRASPRVVYDTSWNTVSQTTNNDDWQGYRNPPDWWSEERRTEWQDRQFTRNDNRWNDWQDYTGYRYDEAHQDWVRDWDRNQSRRNYDQRRSDRSY